MSKEEEGIQLKEQPSKFPEDYYKYDESDALRVIKGMAEHVKDGYGSAEGVRPEHPFHKVIVAGMGGSAIAGDLLKVVMDGDEKCGVTVEVSRGYELPKGGNKNTLLIAVSYSGNTEETITAYKAAVRKGCQAISVSSGGKLEELAKINKHPHIKLPKGLQPRMAVAYLFFPLLKVMENAGAIGDYSKEVKDLIEALRRKDFSKTAIDLSEKLYERIPLIWTDYLFYAVAYRFKTQVNENAKTNAFCHAIPELDHNELLSFSNRIGQYHVVIISTSREHRRVAKRITLMKELIQQKGVPVTEIAVKGSLLKQIFTAIAVGDLTSYYLALRYETDPTPVTAIEEFKKKMGPYVI